jgi:release factor glutamine methyltransferase
MTAEALVSELAGLVGSRREAIWIVEHVVASEVADPRSVALALARRRMAGEPLQYLLGSWPFRTLELELSPAALIPRPETEQLVEVALDRLRRVAPGSGPLVVVDLGAGSGAIGLSVAVELAGERQFELHLSDLSADALALAGRNAARLGVDAWLHEGSWFEALPETLIGRVGLLISNPPYVPCELAGSLDPVLDHEPSGALYAQSGSDGSPGMAEVESILDGLRPWLAPRGLLAVEMGEDQVRPALALAGARGLVELAAFEDLAGRPRGIVGFAP